MRKLYKMGPLQLDPEARVLTDAGVTVALGARGASVLATLVSRANEPVEKSALLDAAWPGLVVEEANLAVQISAIRRALSRVPSGATWIETLPRRGYRFVGPVVEIAGRPARPSVADRGRTNLPELLTSFVGREREQVEIRRVLTTSRLLTLTGPGGIGKTRLAQQVAAELLDAYGDGVWFVDLAPLRDPSLVPSALAQVLQIRESAGQPLLSALCKRLRQQEVLLILDNCEQVLDACARLAETLLGETARVKLIATSREPLHVAAEYAYPLAVLPLPDPKSSRQRIARSDAVQLFVERARQYRPNFDLKEERACAVAEICVRLDGIPLALELAAARVAVLPVEQIVRLLDQRFRLLKSGTHELPRHQTLRGMIDWSYELLDDTEKELFARLSVFAGGWTLAAAETIGAGETLGKDDVVYLMIELIEKSLVVPDNDGERYRLLETMREYAKERLTASRSAEVIRKRHRDYFLGLAEEAEPKLMRAEQADWLRRLEVEHENLRTALEWSLAEPGAEGGLRLCWAMRHFWRIRGHLSEGNQWCMRALGKDGAEAPTEERAKALAAAGILAYWLSDYPAARARHEESLAIRRQLGDQLGISAALSDLGNVALRQGDLASARALYEESLTIKRRMDDRSGMAKILNNLGNAAREQGDLASARALFEESLAIMRELEDRGGIALLLGNLGFVACDQGDFGPAWTLCEESLSIMRVLGDRDGVARLLTYLGRLAYRQGNFMASRELQQQGLTTLWDIGDRRMLANALEGLAAAEAALGSPLHAAHMWGAAERLREAIGSPRQADERTIYARHVAAARSASENDAAFERAWQQGRAATLERTITLALGKTTTRDEDYPAVGNA